MEARLGGGKVNLAANKNKGNGMGEVAKERNEEKEKRGKEKGRRVEREHGVGGSWRKGRKREVTRSRGQRQTKEEGEE